MDAWSSLEIFNAILICFLASEVFSSRKSVLLLWRPLALLAGVNVSFLALQSLDLVSHLSALQETVLVLGETLPLVVLLSCPTALSLLFFKFYVPFSKDKLPWTVVCLAPVFALSVVVLTSIKQKVDTNSVVKLDVIMLSFVSFCYWELRHLFSLPVFFRLMSLAFALVVGAFPFLGIAIAILMLLIANLFDLLGQNSQLLSGPIYYGVFYGPFSAIYFIMKRQARQFRLSLPQ